MFALGGAITDAERGPAPACPGRIKLQLSEIPRGMESAGTFSGFSLARRPRGSLIPDKLRQGRFPLRLSLAGNAPDIDGEPVIFLRSLFAHTAAEGRMEGRRLPAMTAA